MIAARPVVRNLRPASVNLAKATPNISKTFVVLNHLVNMLGFNPNGAGDQHSYLWWLAWLDHNARTVFSIQDANGDYRPLFLQASCATLAQIVNSVTGAETVLNLTPILTNLNLCPKQASADIRAYRQYQAGQSATGQSAARSPGGAAASSAGSRGTQGAASSSSGIPNVPAPTLLPQLPTK